MRVPEREENNHGCQGSTADRSRFQQILEDCIGTVGIDAQGDILIVGDSFKDAYVLHRTGFRRMTLSNIEPMPDYEQQPMNGAKLSMINADVEDMAIADGSYDLVLAHEVLHHYRSPHRALLEMLRVSRKHVIIMEPNDSIMFELSQTLRKHFLRAARYTTLQHIDACSTLIITQCTQNKQIPLTSNLVQQYPIHANTDIDSFAQSVTSIPPSALQVRIYTNYIG